MIVRWIGSATGATRQNGAHRRGRTILRITLLGSDLRNELRDRKKGGHP
jgi:hypothetical protein